jgi:hypothetical protein
MLRLVNMLTLKLFIKHITWWQRDFEHLYICIMDLPVPEQYDFDTEKWPTWKAKFLRFKAAADLSSKPELRQVSMLIYSVGPRT